jgi:hypothetical protein
LLCGLILISGTGAAQWLNYPTPGTPRTKDGKLNLAAKAPRAPPEAAALLQKHSQGGNRESPSTRCVPQGILRGELDNYLPFKILQTPAVIAVLYEESNTYRQIYTDSRQLPVNPQPAWMGYSVGRWEGDTLVVDAAGFNDQGWLDAMGHPQSEDLRIRERFHRRDFGHMDLELTIDDPKTYTEPFTVKATEVLVSTARTARGSGTG